MSLTKRNEKEFYYKNILSKTKNQAILITIKYLLLLLGDTNGTSTTTSGLGVLTTDTDTPVVTETTMVTDLLQTFKIITVLGVKNVRDNLRGLAINNILLSVKEPGGDLVLSRVLEDSDNTLQFFAGEFTGSLGEIDISLLTGNVGETTTNTLDRGQGDLNLDTTVNVSVKKTKNVLELIVYKDKIKEGLVYFVKVL
jgi:hypothetical protein